jgi:hypothetical protein
MWCQCAKLRIPFADILNRTSNDLCRPNKCVDAAGYCCPIGRTCSFERSLCGKSGYIHIDSLKRAVASYFEGEASFLVLEIKGIRR